MQGTAATRDAASSSAAITLRPGSPSAAAPPAPALVLDSISKRWQSNGPPVLSGVNLQLDRGVAVAISGPNGSGKTTLLRIATGLISPDFGAVRACGLDPTRDRSEFQRHVGFLAAGNSGLYGRLKAEQHLELCARLALMPKRARVAAISRALETFGLEPLCGRRVDRLSMGQRQRLRLALAFVHGPSLVLLDEPATSLDEDGIVTLQAALGELTARGGAAVVCLPTGWDKLLSVDRRYRLTGGQLEAE